MGHSDSERSLVQGVEKRASIRVVYETLLLVAEYDGDVFPPFSAFWEVKTKDLSVHGVGFISPRRPESETLLLMFGNPQAKPIFIKARVARCVENTLENKPSYTVGCELMERIQG